MGEGLCLSFGQTLTRSHPRPCADLLSRPRALPGHGGLPIPDPHICLQGMESQDDRYGNPDSGL